MLFTEIKTLLDQGFTPEQIMELSRTENAAAPAEVQPTAAPAEVQPAEAAPAEPSVDRIASLEKTISELTKTIQANAIRYDMQPGQSVQSDMEILASMINPAVNNK